tara:strand:- start:5752 stop:6072 length:321 start_codon:yes stop_codon:yes gene_type:complete
MVNPIINVAFSMICSLPSGSLAGQGPATLGAAYTLYAEHGEQTTQTDAFMTLIREGRMWTTGDRQKIELLGDPMKPEFSMPVRDENGKTFYVVSEQIDCGQKGQGE